MKKKWNGLNAKILGMAVGPVLLLFIVTTILTITSTRKNLMNLTYQNLYGAGRGMEIALSQSSATFEKDEVVSLFSMLSQDTGYQYTMYLKDKVHSSSIKVDGKMLTQNLDSDIYSRVAGGERYTDDNVNINGTRYIGLYYPVEQNGEVFGVMFCATKYSEVMSVIQSSSVGSIIVSFIVLAASLCLTLFVIRGINKSLKAANHSVSQLSNGDLSAIQLEGINLERIAQGSDELSEVVSNVTSLRSKLYENISAIKENYSGLLQSETELKEVVGVCNTASSEISNAIDEIAHGSVTQAEELDNASKQVTTMETAIDNISENIDHSATVVHSMMDSSNKTRTAFTEFLDANNQTAKSIDKIGKQIENSADASNQIVKAVEMINDIASQTSLLSLNASIEAARAGEAGKGFAVVAEQIKQLSEQSASSAQDIREVVDKLNSENQLNIEMANELKDITQKQTSVMEQSTSELKQLLDYINQIKEVLDMISSHNVEVTQAKGALVSTITALSTIAESNAAASEETTASMQELNANINILNDSTDKLHTMADNLNEQISFYQL